MKQEQHPLYALTPGEPIVPTRRPKAEKEPPDPAVKRVVDAFHQKFIERHGCPPIKPNYGRFAKDVKEMLPAIPEEEIVQLFDDFFASTDPWVVRSGWAPAAFVQVAQNLRLRRRGTIRKVDPRTADNIDAARRATGRR